MSEWFEAAIIIGLAVIAFMLWMVLETVNRGLGSILDELRRR